MGKDTAGLRILTREEILAARDIPEEIVECPEWGGSVLVRGLCLGEALRAIKDMAEWPERDVDKMNLWAIAHGICGPDGEPLFTEEDYEALLKKSSAATLRVAKVFTRISGLGEEAVEETAKNSSATGGSG